MRTQLLCTFTAPKVLHKTVDTIIESYDISTIWEDELEQEIESFFMLK